MREKPTSRMLWLFATFLLALLVANGCQSTPSLPIGAEAAHNSTGRLDASAKPSILRPGMEVEWSIKSAVVQAGEVRTGRSVVGPDGAMNMGPYGYCFVAGKTLEQANGVAERQLALFIKQPRVAMSVVLSSTPTEITWKKAASPLNEMVAQNQANPPLLKDNPIRPAAFQPPLGPNPATNPIPVVTVKENAEAPSVQGHPMLLKRLGDRLHPPAEAVPPPPALSGPNELHPVLMPSYMIRPPDVLLIESQKGLLTQPVRGQHLVRPDGSVGLGIYGSVVVAGTTLEEARERIAATIYSKMAQKPYPKKNAKGEIEKDKDDNPILINPPKLVDVRDGLSVDVLAYNSAVYYVITDGAGLGEQLFRFPITGNENVLDAISHIGGLPPVASKRVWIARRNDGHSGTSIYPVDWKGVTQFGAANTNWQIMPGDRIYVRADDMRRFNVTLAKFLEPVERILGVTLLGGQAVNTIRNSNNNSTSNR